MSSKATVSMARVQLVRREWMNAVRGDNMSDRVHEQRLDWLVDRANAYQKHGDEEGRLAANWLIDFNFPPDGVERVA